MNSKHFLKRDDFKDKFVFWDIDGTLAAFRFNGKITDAPTEDFINDIHNGVFLERDPSKFMQRILSDIDPAKNIVLGHCCCQREIDDKTIWTRKHFPTISDIVFVTYPDLKKDAILKYCTKNNIPIEKCIFIDDMVQNLSPAMAAGIDSWHISSLLDYFE